MSQLSDGTFVVNTLDRGIRGCHGDDGCCAWPVSVAVTFTICTADDLFTWRCRTEHHHLDTDRDIPLCGICALKVYRWDSCAVVTTLQPDLAPTE